MSYDIFLSYRGLDTRKKFTDHLYAALKREGFHTFIDGDEIERGEIIKSELQQAIWNSRMSIIVLSKNYANSTACLFEIQTINEHRKKSDHVILPVFYEVDPLEIRAQAKNLDLGIKKVTVEEVEGWSAALTDVTSMAGMVFPNQSDGYEAKFIEEIVGVLKRKLAGDHPRAVDDQELDRSMKILKRKVEYLSDQEYDINKHSTSAEHRTWKRGKTKKVKVWLPDLQQLKDDVQRLEQEVDGEGKIFSRAQLGKGIDEFPTGKLLMPPTADFVESSKAGNLERIWECLMNDEDIQIGVFGMGGVGKTTIMKHIHNQVLKETGKFDYVFWVTVSKPFNIIKLQSDIAKELSISLSDEEDEEVRAMHLFAVLSLKKRYVLIIDDVWEAFPLERVGIPSPTIANGSKLVLITRSFEVCRRMGCKTVKVELLTEQEALSLFLKKAVANDTALAPEVEEIAAQIAKECACLPLAIVTVAESLHGLNLSHGHEWRNALNELIRLTKDASNGESAVFEILKFSYSRLGNEMLQNCFLYVSLYPEEKNIPVEELIEYWIAEELIADMDSVEAQFDKGRAILVKLTNTSLLDSFIDKDGNHFIQIHDLIRDMALKITASGPRFMVKAGESIDSVAYEHWNEDLERISFMESCITELPVTPPFCPRLTTLLLSHTNLKEIPDSFFTYMCCLKVLDLSFNDKIESLPESISNLENLHALLLDACGNLNYVPSLEKLKALKVFTLTRSSIKNLPEGIEEVVNLTKLDLSDNFDLGSFPSYKLRMLSKLKFLRMDGTGAKVSAEDLLFLRKLKVVAVHFHNVQELTRYVTSQHWQGLEKYWLLVGEKQGDGLKINGKEVCIYSRSEPLVSGVAHQLVLPANMDLFQLAGFDNLINLSAISSLKDARNLRRCNVSYSNGLESIFSSSSFSADGHIFLGTVEELELSLLPSYRVLFDGIAPRHNISFNLKNLVFWRCDIMKNIFPVQFLQNFPNLETLRVWDCENVEDIIVEKEEMNNRDHRPDDINTIKLPRLQTLELEGLPRLKSIYNGMMVCQSIEKVIVAHCPMVRRLPLSLHMDSQQATAPPSLKLIKADEEWWESLEWDDPLTKTILQPFLNRDCLRYNELDLPTPHPKSREEKDSERMQLQVHHYPDATMSTFNSESDNCTASDGGELSMEDLADEVSYTLEEEFSEQISSEEISLEECVETSSTLCMHQHVTPKAASTCNWLKSPRKFEDLNYDVEIPPTLYHHFSILLKLDLSYTEIKSLPQSISRLVALQKLILRSCELLMELPPEIGELTNLEVLDLEGTEILCLPKEIAKLVNLTCLKVSFYGYASQTVQTVIPRGVLSNLTRLIELIIDVSPYGEWWDVEVEAIIDDLRSLKQLVTLKMYVPTTILLEELKCMFPGLSNFRFTVGRHEEHFISRLPHDVEEEFNNLEKGLKYINGSHMPSEITKVFNPNAFFLQRHWTAKSLSDFGHGNIDEVKFCLVMECNEFRTIIDSEQFYQGKDATVLGSLERLIIRYVKNVESIWKGPLGKGSLSNLKSLVVHTCPNLATLLTIDMLSNLSNLEELTVEDCPKIDSLVSLKSSGSKSDLFLPRLKKISLLHVPELVSISSGLWIAPKLERMVIFNCPKLERLSTKEVSSTELKVIKGEKEWWAALKWYESDLSTEHEDYLARHFIPLRRDGDLIAQLTKD